MINSQGVKWDMNIRKSLRIVLPIIIGSLNHTFFHHWFNTFQLAKCHLKPWTTAPSNQQIYQNVPNHVVYVCVITSHYVTLLLKTSTSRRCFRNPKQSPGMLVKPLWILVDIYFCRISSIKWPDDCCAEYQCSASGSTKVGTCDRYVKWRCNN